MAVSDKSGGFDGVKTDILLESGTNELEIMEFTIAGNVFGINVAKVTEIMKYSKVNPMPNSHPNIEGVFKPRTNIITVIDLPGYMGLPPSENDERDMFIITNFNKMSAAFHVHTVEGIHRITWTDIEKPDNTIYGGQEGLATGIAKITDKLITIVDFEKIIYDISPLTGIQMEEISALGPRERSARPIVMAEDSALLKKMILEALQEAGYTNITSFTNGQDAWDHIQELSNQYDTIKDFAEHVSLLITDIEMPKMDGHRLLKLCREHKILKGLPVLIFSSLIDEAMFDKGERLGATAQLSKPEIGNLVATIDKFILK
ncbi:MAG: chemotaxis protein [Oscillospiraceae bacterium]|nr:chemotaxis protein [Oscillospiraceae bacterium]